MRKTYVMSMVVMLLLTALVIIIPSSETAQAATLTVGSDQAYTTIQGAIDAASDGDIIRINAGIYDERITVDKTLTLIGNGTEETKLISSGGDIITISADWVNITHLTASVETTSGSYSGIELSSYYDHVTIENCNVATTIMVSGPMRPAATTPST
jgi:pectin methylesterase-like acyl-CoA thioesterase